MIIAMRLTRRLLGNRATKDPLSKISIDDSGLIYEGIEDRDKYWRTQYGDCVSLHYFGIPPDIPSGQSSIDEFRAKYRSNVEVDLVEIRICTVAGVSVVRTIAKIPQDPVGITYVGAYTIPFRDFSYVLKISCEEHGMTGAREAVLVARGLSRGDISIDDSGGIQGNWAPDDEAHDSIFPEHPLPRCRAGLRMFESSLTIADELKRLPKFKLPTEG